MNSRNLVDGTSELSQTGSEILDLAPTTADHQFSSDNQQFFLLDYWRVLLKRRWVILGVLTFVFAAAIIVSLRTAPMYRAAGQITINKENHNPLGFKENTATDDQDVSLNVELATQLRILQSNSLAVQAVQKLQSDEQFKGSTASAPDMDFKASLTGPPQLPKSNKLSGPADLGLVSRS